ncbi:hypothetical protein D3880_10540 [Pseudomonas cavernae]|uniref:Uncharacterized protein n=1 Tax=Pseudomonas cavernae TaxID=2320867 RepID=A0A385Z5K8_9PSED|nr:hypothetical protein [Pseudomonas cavernae]AYC32792.1 hypothetical protein D3880_10540 [Pseudomonas cavernae]
MSLNSSTFYADGYRSGFSRESAPGSPASVHDQEFADGFAQGAADRELADGLKASIVNLLDGEPITSFANFEAFTDWLDAEQRRAAHRAALLCSSRPRKFDQHRVVFPHVACSPPS